MQGDKGDQGIPGADGADGADGVSGYEVVTVTTVAGTSLNPNTSANIAVVCPEIEPGGARKVPLGGGYSASVVVPWFFPNGVRLLTSRPTGPGVIASETNGWLVQVRNGTNTAKTIAGITVYAICATVAP